MLPILNIGKLALQTPGLIILAGLWLAMWVAEKTYRKFAVEPAAVTWDLESHMKEYFRRFAHTTSDIVGSPAAFLVGLLVIVIWGITGPMFHYSDTWQLVINTSTTIVTFLMVFLIQNTQNRDTLALQIKLSELIVAMKGADNKLAAIEDATDQELEQAHEKAKHKSEKS